MTGYIALGSNLGDREENLNRAIKMMGEVPGVTFRRASAFHNCAAMGGPPDQPDYLDAVAEIETDLPPEELLAKLQQIENALGRERNERWGPRTIDLDIILLGDTTVDEPALTIPHALMHQREFVLAPLCELAPDTLHPVLQRTAEELLAGLRNGA